MKEDNLFNVGDDTCDITVLHEKPIRRAKEQLMSENTYMELSETFKIFEIQQDLKFYHYCL